MQTMTGKTEGKHSALLEVLAMETGERAAVHGLVHTLRDLGDVRFALLRMPQGVLQCVLGADEDVRDGDAVEISGEVVRDERAPGGAELHAQSVKVLSRAAEAMPVPIGKNKMNLSLDTDLALRFVTLRNLRKRAVFKIQEGIVPEDRRAERGGRREPVPHGIFRPPRVSGSESAVLQAGDGAGLRARV